jgi:hypothetical protein
MERVLAYQERDDMSRMKGLFIVVCTLVLIRPLFAAADTEQLSFDGLWPRSNFAKLCICAKLIWVDLEDLSTAKDLPDQIITAKSYTLYKEADELLVALHQMSTARAESVTIKEWCLFYTILMNITSQYTEVVRLFSNIYLTKIGVIFCGLTDYLKNSIFKNSIHDHCRSNIGL